MGRRGSALLIVLGMLSFMVISAVGFSMYMRQTRLPSSYLRRNIAARHLVRASLARAIEELEGDFNEDRNWGKYNIDETDVKCRFYGIYDDPYPGCGTDTTRTQDEDGDFVCDEELFFFRNAEDSGRHLVLLPETELFDAVSECRWKQK